MEEEQVFDIENRRSKRIPVGMHLEVSSVFKQNNVYVSNINAPIEVVDISKYGIGFVSASVLPIGFYFDSRLKFEDERDCINCVVRIVRLALGEVFFYFFFVDFKVNSVFGRYDTVAIAVN